MSCEEALKLCNTILLALLNIPGGRVSTLDIHLAVALDRQEITVAEGTQGPRTYRFAAQRLRERFCQASR